MTARSEDDMDGPGWRLGSTQGDTCLCGRASTSIGADASSAASGLVDISVTYYDLPQDRTSPAAVFEVHALEIDADALQRLSTTLRKWLALPLAELAHTPLVLTANLAANSWDAFTLSFGPRTDLIMTAGSVGCEVEIAASGVLRLTHRFVTDPTVLAAFVDGIARSQPVGP